MTVEDGNGNRLGFWRVNPGAEATKSIQLDAATTVHMIVGEGRGEYSIKVG